MNLFIVKIDAISLNFLTKELNQKLAGSKINKISSPDPEDILFSLYTPKRKFLLLISVKNNLPRIHTVNKSVPGQTAGSFCMSLRNHLKGFKLIEISQPHLERTIFLDFQSYKNETKRIIFKIAPKNPNLYLLDYQNKVISSLKHKADITPGQIYQLESKLPGPSFLDITLDEFLKVCSLGPEKTIREILFKNIWGLNNNLIKEILTLAKINTDILIKDLSNHKLKEILHQLEMIVKKIKNNNYQPVLYKNKENLTPKILTPWLYKTLSTYFHKTYKTLDSLCQDFYMTFTALNEFQILKSKIYRIISSALKKAKRKLDILKEESAKAGKYDQKKKIGELILINLKQIPLKSPQVQLKDIYQDDDLIKIKLDPRLTPAENAQKYFKKYQKLKRATRHLNIQLNKTLGEVNYLEQVLFTLDQAQNQTQLREIEIELRQTGLLKKPKVKGKQKEEKEKLTCSFPQVFQSPDGFKIIAGKNNRQNDYLTFKLANKFDIWLHARNMPGAHVVIKLNSTSEKVPPETLRTAAQLAAYHSKARNSAKAEIIYTQAKNIKKFPGAKPGQVIYRNEKVIVVRPKKY